jgi:hypothetical protein
MLRRWSASEDGWIAISVGLSWPTPSRCSRRVDANTHFVLWPKPCEIVIKPCQSAIDEFITCSPTGGTGSMKSLRAFIWPSVHRAVPQPASPSGSLCCTFVRSRRVVDPRRLAVNAIHQMPHLIPGEIFSSATFPAQKSSWRATTCCTRKPVLRDRRLSTAAGRPPYLPAGAKASLSSQVR